MKMLVINRVYHNFVVLVVGKKQFHFHFHFQASWAHWTQVRTVAGKVKVKYKYTSGGGRAFGAVKNPLPAEWECWLSGSFPPSSRASPWQQQSPLKTSSSSAPGDVQTHLQKKTKRKTSLMANWPKQGQSLISCLRHSAYLARSAGNT